MFDISEGGSKSRSLDKTSTFGQKSFEVDHSFLFLVWDYYSGMLLLMGRVVNPLEDAWLTLYKDIKTSCVIKDKITLNHESVINCDSYYKHYFKVMKIIKP